MKVGLRVGTEVGSKVDSKVGSNVGWIVVGGALTSIEGWYVVVWVVGWAVASIVGCEDTVGWKVGAVGCIVVGSELTVGWNDALNGRKKTEIQKKNIKMSAINNFVTKASKITYVGWKEIVGWLLMVGCRVDLLLKMVRSKKWQVETLKKLKINL